MLVKSNRIPVMPSIFDDFFKDWSLSNYSDTNTTLPAVNIKENENEFTVEVAVPGMDKKDFKINLDDNVLTISSEKIYENEDENDKYTRKEYSYQSFERSFNLPKDVVNSDKITANYKNGELVINIPKKEEAKPIPPKLIEVK
ncbi:Hsp20/alpha crystallin family protein [Lutibacter sp.]|uniref:Hsp20/alpha crystallin family protein n=1 Tax=Lutibacter sp. TaxID=1925666 RepID=UPI0025B83DC0|nr:Hsp20/alpha crystallin family protein [Lutibacter sp.]MCF6182983.1 Hsp20/alpha crystallin family protein [Lutibacter sp.]